jgi:two-component system LytT family response regulator
VRKIRVLIVDDEPLARLRIRNLLKADPRIEIAGEAGNGPDAAEAIRRDSPDLVFLDVQMPAMDGFETLRTLGPGRTPHIVFVTAYDQYALKAFECHALDYLLKPFLRSRFRQALDRAVEIIRAGRIDQALDERLAALLREPREKGGFGDLLAVKTGDRTRLVKVEEIDWIEAAEKYVVLHCGAEKHMIRRGIAEMERRLDPRRFLRVHRSSLVRIDAIREIQPWFHGQSILLLKSGETIAVGRAYRSKLETILQG